MSCPVATPGRPPLPTSSPRRKSGGEVAVLAYQALCEGEQTGTELFEALLKGVSTRNCREVIPRLADSASPYARKESPPSTATTWPVTKSEVSRLTTASATSSPRPGRSMGVTDTRCSMSVGISEPN